VVFGHARARNVRTAEVGDGVGDGERGADALAAPGHVFAEQQLGEPLLHHLHLWRFHARGAAGTHDDGVRDCTSGRDQTDRRIIRAGVRT
jgi:hypothetical protein